MEKKIPKLTVQLVAAIAICLAMVMVVENYFSIRLSETLQVQFTFIPNAILGAIAGPIWAALAAAISDPVFVLFSGQTMMVSFILIEAVSAFLYGWFFHGKPLDTKNGKDWLYVAAAMIVIQLVISFGLTPLALHFQFSTPLVALYSARLIKAVIEIPLRTLVTMLVLSNLQRIPEFRKLIGLKR